MWYVNEDQSTEQDEDYNDDLYQILGCSENASSEQISTEYKLLALKYHPDKNPGNKRAVQQFQKLQDAVNTLLDESKRREYDKWRHSEISIPFKQWTSMNSRVQTSMHWAKPREQVMLEAGPLPASDLQQSEISPLGSTEGDAVESQGKMKLQAESARRSWQSDSSDVYKGFRNYKI